MSQGYVEVQDRVAQNHPFSAPIAYLRHRGLVNATEILRVLDRAADDDEFIARLTHSGSKALAGYDLTAEARAALLSGDVNWIEDRVGKLDERQRAWLDCRLQQEIW